MGINSRLVFASVNFWVSGFNSMLSIAHAQSGKAVWSVVSAVLMLVTLLVGTALAISVAQQCETAVPEVDSRE